MLGLSPGAAALVLLIAVTPICAWVCYTDLKYMKIRNTSVAALLAVFAVVGPFVLPLDEWAWRWVHFVVVLAIGFVLNMIAHFGAGDAKFAAAAAPFFSSAPAHIQLMIFLLAAFLLAAFTTHRLMRAIPAIRAMAPDWVSWTRKDFPLGLALAGTLWAYLALVSAVA
ncbi:prepilin peptidase [Sedimentimonas flavescens]|uniref:Prepilin peptidase n=1 Tax=Sedimentimonas flavescens TaxID=2851012 RepID=A0ABT2ZUD7_9RHOB|nr:prepilin peptidase [Sedimentimonas flavescens]MCV2877354.1 prepilin peptidase [Sedimentimonas flavescens]